MAVPSRRQSAPAPPPVRVADRLHAAAIHLLRALRPADRASGLSGPRLSALSVAVFAGPIRLTALARAEQVRAPTMSRIARGLEGAGLIRRGVDPADRRAQLFTATAKGRRMLGAARRRRVARLAAALARRSAGERRRLLEAARIIEAVSRDA